jgi:hypothetical protein
MLKPRFSPGELRRRMVAELWFYPDGSRTLELSTKCLPAETFRPPPQGLPSRVFRQVGALAWPVNKRPRPRRRIESSLTACMPAPRRNGTADP